MKNVLLDIGLTEKEVLIFETLLKKGEMTIVQISRETNISRSYCYDALDSLMAKGFATKVILNKKNAWKSTPINRIMEHIDSIKDEVKKKIEETIPKKEEEMKINLYKGIKGIKVVCDGVLTSSTKIIGWGAEGQLEKYLPHYYKYFKKVCVERNLKADFVTMKNMNPLAMTNVDIKKFPIHFDTNVEINVYDNKTIILFWKDKPEAIEILDKNVANSFRNYHKIFWEKL